MYSLESIIKLADNELMSIAEKGQFRNREDVDTAYKLIDIIEDIYCIWKMEEEDGYSEYSGEGRSNRGSYEGGSYRGGRSNRGSYEGGRSYRGSYEGGRSRASYRGGYSRADYMDEMRRMMESAPDDQTRQSIQRMINQMEQQM